MGIRELLLEQFQKRLILILVNNLAQVDSSREINQGNRNKATLMVLMCYKQIQLLHTLKSVVRHEVFKKLNFKEMPFWLNSPNSLKHI